jgi:hypothetical protein
VPRRDGLPDAFDDDGRFENLDPILFADAQDASTFPLKVYRIRSAQP